MRQDAAGPSGLVAPIGPPCTPSEWRSSRWEVARALADEARILNGRADIALSERR